jgi:arylsulfatase A-like enzyme
MEQRYALTRRDFLELGGAGAAAARGENGQAPNIVLMLGDDHRWEALGCMGNRVIRTPELDRLSEAGVTFENHFTTTAICCVSRASIFLSQYAAVHGINDFDKPLDAGQVKRMYPALLRAAGYHTGFIGKFGVGRTMPETAFDVWNGFGGQGQYFPQGPAGPHLTDIMRDQALEFIENAPRERPFCLSISFKAPHVQDEDPRQYLPSRETLRLYQGETIPGPSGAPEKDIARFPLAFQHSENRRRWAVRFSTEALYQESMKGYYRLISGIDSAVGAIRDALAQRKLDANTIVIYSADHGIFLGEHGFAGKWLMHEESIRMPLIIYDPRATGAARGARRRAMTLNQDLPATVADFAGLGHPAFYQGRSLRGLLARDEPEWRASWYYEHHFPYRGWIPSSEGVRTRRWKYVKYTDVAKPFEELYDLREDGHETRNLAGSAAHKPVMRAMEAYYGKWKAALAGWDGRSEWVDPVAEEELKRDGME